jgi:hypothetical protein
MYRKIQNFNKNLTIIPEIKLNIGKNLHLRSKEKLRKDLA